MLSIFQQFKITPSKGQQSTSGINTSSSQIYTLAYWCRNVWPGMLKLWTGAAVAWINILLTGSLGSGMGSNTHCASPRPRESRPVKRFTIHHQNTIRNCSLSTQQHHNSSIQTKHGGTLKEEADHHPASTDFFSLKRKDGIEMTLFSNLNKQIKNVIEKSGFKECIFISPMLPGD